MLAGWDVPRNDSQPRWSWRIALSAVRVGGLNQGPQLVLKDRSGGPKVRRRGDGVWYAQVVMRRRLKSGNVHRGRVELQEASRR
jgi:hypothetical protein